MDTALSNGDFSRSPSGIPFALSGPDELLQRASIRLLVPKGSFPFDPDLGSSLFALDPLDPDFYHHALGAAQEALLPLSQLQIRTLALQDHSLALSFDSPYGPLSLLCPVWKEVS